MNPGAARPGDELLVVDCLLPGQVRQLGRMKSFLTARRPIKTTARDCEIRGGEYVAYDRASYGSALKIWLPMAEAGDVEAQLNVGEIFEKGLGLPPDYQAAAGWYQRAAEQGSSAAAVNLGNLYERGLGVPKDPAQALNWYRRAAGLPDAVIMDAGTLNQTREEMSSMRAEVQRSREEVQQLRGQLEQARQELDKTRRQLEQRERDAKAQRARLEEARRSLETRVRSAQNQGDSAGAQKLRAELEARERELARRDSELAGLRAEIARVSAETARRDQQIVQLEQEKGEKGAALDALRAQAERSEKDAQLLSAQLDEARLQLDQAQERLQRQSDASAAARTQTRESREQAAALEARLTDTHGKLGAVTSSLDRTTRDLATERQQVELLRAELERERSAAGRDEAKVRRLEAALAERAQIASQQQSALAGLREQFDRVRREAEEYRTRLAEFTAERDRELERVQARDQAQAQALEQARAREQARLQELEQARAREQARAQELEQAKRRDRARVQELEQARAREQAKVQELEQALGREQAKAKAQEQAQALALTRQAEAVAAVEPPIIEMLDPELATTRGPAPEVVLRSAVPSREVVGKVVAAAGLMTLTVNDAPGRANEAGVFRSSVALPSERTPVTIVAVDKQGNRATLSFDIVRGQPRAAVAADGERAAEPPPAPAKAGVDLGRYHALIIGNDEYAKLPRLRTAVADAREVDSILRTRYGFRTKLLVNASRYQILSALNDFREVLTENDNLLVYYAGHGELDRKNLRGHWLPVDAERGNSANWISNVSITDLLNVMVAKQILVVADSCYSGALTRSALGQLRAGMSADAKERWMQVMAKKRSRTVLTSGGEQPVLDSAGGKHSVFAAAFIEVLRDNRAVLEGGRLFSEVSQRVRRVMENLQFNQEPEYAPLKYAGHEGGDFFFVPSS